jgi:hypothetical protein
MGTPVVRSDRREDSLQPPRMTLRKIEPYRSRGAEVLWCGVVACSAREASEVDGLALERDRKHARPRVRHR